MVDKFNFYDIYGNLIPGIILLIILLVPIALLRQSIPISLNDFSALILGVAIAYVIGHFLQSMATNATPSKFNGQYPSSQVLNQNNPAFTFEVKQELARQALGDFKLDLGIEKNSETETNKARGDAFLLARASANARRSGTYSEQFQGLYSMMRGLTLTFAFGACYYAGWGLSASHAPCLQTLVIVALIAAVLATVVCAVCRFSQDLGDKRRIPLDRSALIALGTIFLTAGTLLGLQNSLGVYNIVIFWLTSGLCSAAAFRFFVSYKFFATEFAKAVWIGYYTQGKLGRY